MLVATSVKECDEKLITEAPELLEALKVIRECGPPEPASLYDEEGVEGWKWTHPDGREWCEIGSWNEPPPIHPIVDEAIARAEGHPVAIALGHAAPDLLAACKAVAAECRAVFVDTDEMSAEWRAILKKIDAAIAAAERK